MAKAVLSIAIVAMGNDKSEAVLNTLITINENTKKQAYAMIMASLPDHDNFLPHQVERMLSSILDGDRLDSDYFHHYDHLVSIAVIDGDREDLRAYI